MEKDLFFVLCCEYNFCHDWMAFASWYSFNYYLPDAEVVIAIKRAVPLMDLFTWPPKCRKKILYCNDFDDLKFEGPILKIPPTVMAVRDYDENLFGPVSSKSSDQATLVDYSEGCGKFVASDWINRTETPFLNAMKRFVIESLTINEAAILKLWEKTYVLRTFMAT